MSDPGLTTFPGVPKPPRPNNDPARLAPRTPGEPVADGIESILSTLSDPHKEQIEGFIALEKMRICERLANLANDATADEKRDLQASAIAVIKLENYIKRAKP